MRFRKKPVVIDAIQWTGDNQEEVRKFLGKGEGFLWRFEGETVLIYTLEGWHTASLWDFLIEGIRGEHYPCKPGIFRDTYDEVVPEPRTEEEKARDDAFEGWMTAHEIIEEGHH